MGHGLYERLQATHRYYQPCQHPGPEGWAVTDTRPRATCREQPWATSSYVTTAITYWVTRPGGLGVGPTRVVVNGNPRTAPDAYLRLPAPGLRTDGPSNENRYAHAPQPGSPPRESHPHAYHTVARTASSHGPHAIIRQPAHVTRLAGYRPTTRVLPLGRARLYLEHNSHGSRHITQHRACRIMSASCNPTAHSAPAPCPTSEVVAPAGV